MSSKHVRGIHDLGGLPAGPVDTHEHTPTLTERRIDAMMMVLRASRSLWRTDENRRTIESMAPHLYEGASYYERWVYSMRSQLIEKGVLTEAEIEAKLAEVRARHGASPGKGKARPVKAASRKRGATRPKARARKGKSS
jgi:hypothetical protein